MKLSTASLLFVAPVFRVAQLDRAIDYYRDKLGFELEFCYEGFYASVRRDDCRVHLQCAAPAARDQAAFEHSEHIDACVVVRDISTLWTSLQSSGASFTVPLRTMPYGKEFYVRDPEGYILGFVEPAEDGDDGHAERAT